MTFDQLFGDGRDLTTLQMAARAFVMFFALLALIRLAGMRSFGRTSSFDAVIVIALGAVLSRVIVGASPAIPTIAAATVLVVVHRVVAVLTARSTRLEQLVKGRSHVIYRGGIFDMKRMQRAGISRADIDEAVRKHVNSPTLKEVLEIWLEPSGHLTIIEDKIGKANRAASGRLTAATAG